MLDALRADQEIRQLTHGFGFTFDHDYFQAGVVIQMSVGCGDDQILIIMLKIYQSIRQEAGMMIVNQSDGPHYGSTRRFYGSHYKPVPNQIAESLGTICVALLCYELVEAPQEIGVDRDTNAAENSHKQFLAII
jgi:hypothetical protein